MINIRNLVFETNSSSVHTMTITDEDTYNKWIKGELLYVDEEGGWWRLRNTSWDEKEEFVTKERAVDLYAEIDENCRCDFFYIFKTYPQWYDYYNYELYTYKEYYKTKEGSNIVAFGAYGYNG